MMKRTDVMFKNNRFYNIELLLLSLLSKSDLESFEISRIINKQSQGYIKIKDGVLFTTLYHFENSHLISCYEEENVLYYHLEEAGRVRLEMLQREYDHLIYGINQVLNYQPKKVKNHE